MIISIVCCDKYFGIGKNNHLLFSLKKDMEFFKKTTLNHTVALGKNTLLSFPNSKPLKNRKHIVLSTSTNLMYDDVENVHNLDSFLNEIKKESEKDDVFIIGGASIYQQTLEYVDKIYLTKVDADGNADVFFNNLDENKNFKIIEKSEVIKDGHYDICFLKYLNLNKKQI